MQRRALTRFGMGFVVFGAIACGPESRSTQKAANRRASPESMEVFSELDGLLHYFTESGHAPVVPLATAVREAVSSMRESAASTRREEGGTRYLRVSFPGGYVEVRKGPSPPSVRSGTRFLASVEVVPPAPRRAPEIGASGLCAQWWIDVGADGIPRAAGSLDGLPDYRPETFEYYRDRGVVVVGFTAEQGSAGWRISPTLFSVETVNGQPAYRQRIARWKEGQQETDSVLQSEELVTFCKAIDDRLEDVRPLVSPSADEAR